ncbi:hypothetical protein BCAR13_1560007 [Paraburkholderia caribensis]|nr:hypothetical protein BCAR13_1560007 [Paraburkholderia caribensis]
MADTQPCAHLGHPTRGGGFSLVLSARYVCQASRGHRGNLCRSYPLPAMQEQFDAILYLGPPRALTWSQLSPALSSNPEYTKMRSQRLAWAGMGDGG